MNYFTADQAAEKLGVCKETILRRIRDGALPVVKITPRIFRIPEESLQQFIKDHTTGAHKKRR